MKKHIFIYSIVTILLMALGSAGVLAAIMHFSEQKAGRELSDGQFYNDGK